MTESDNALMLRVAREEIKRQAAEIERLQHWQRAVDDACTVSWVPVTDDARETVKALIARECQISLDPLVSSDAQALMDRGKEEAAAEIERLKTRLEVSPEHPYDGIASRDATIKQQEGRIAELQADAARYRYIRTHRIGVKWCELYAGGPALDEAIDATMAAGERAYR